MTLTLELPASVEAALARRAAQQGTTPERLALADMERLYPAMGEEEKAIRALTPEERVQHFLAWADSHSSTAPVIPLKAFDRENLYADDGVAA